MSRIAIIVLAVVAALPSTAVAGPEQAAEDHLARGVSLRRQGRTEQALVEFQSAHAAAPSGRTLAQMGLAEQALQRWVEAEEHLVMALDDASPWIEKNRTAIAASLRKVREHIGDLVVRGPAGAYVHINGRNMGRLPRVEPFRVAKGEVSVVVMAAGRGEFTKWIGIRGGGTHEVVAVLPPPVSAAPAPSPPEITKGPVMSPRLDDRGATWTGRRLAGVGLLAVGVAGVAVGSTLYVLDGNDSCNTALGFACNGRRASKTTAFVLGGAGVAASAVGGWLLLGGESKPGAALTVSPHVLGATVSGRF
jgi:hypothetical protein